MESMHRQGRLPGPPHLAIGQEAVEVGAAFALGPGDSLFATAWDLAAQLARGVEVGGVLADAWGRVGGPTRGRDADGHGNWLGARTFTAPTTISGCAPEAAGAALAEGDPVERFAEVLVSEGTLDGAGVEAIGSRAAREFNRAYELGQRSPLPDPSELTAGGFAAGGRV